MVITILRLHCVLALVILAGCSSADKLRSHWPQYKTNPFVIQLEIPGPKDTAGGLVTADLNGDELLDYLVTVPNHLAAYAHDGLKLWIAETDIQLGGPSENVGLPGHHGPGVQVADVDNDGRAEVL